MWTVNEAVIGTTGFEYGTIIFDIEYANQARISLEKGTQIAPFTITTGIFRLLFHTIFCQDEQEANHKINLLKELIQKVIYILEVEKGDDLDYVLDAIVHL